MLEKLKKANLVLTEALELKEADANYEQVEQAPLAELEDKLATVLGSKVSLHWENGSVVSDELKEEFGIIKNVFKTARMRTYSPAKQLDNGEYWFGPMWINFELTAGGRNSFEVSGNIWLTKENTWIVKDFQGQVINI